LSPLTRILLTFSVFFYPECSIHVAAGRLAVFPTDDVVTLFEPRLSFDQLRDFLLAYPFWFR
jgi:hypothetical protein